MPQKRLFLTFLSMQNTILSEKTHKFAMKIVQKMQKNQTGNVKKSTSRQYQNAGQVRCNCYSFVDFWHMWIYMLLID